MKKFYLLRADGSSVFQQAYSEDFIFHCLSCLLARSDEAKYYLCEIGSIKPSFSLSADILKYIRK